MPGRGGTGGVESFGRGCESGGIGPGGVESEGTESGGTVSRGMVSSGGTTGSPTTPVFGSTDGSEPQEMADGSNASQGRAHTCRERRAGFTGLRIVIMTAATLQGRGSRSAHRVLN